MNCPHNDQPCQHAAYCDMTAPEAKVDACFSFLHRLGTNRIACSQCAVKPCKFQCFRLHYERNRNASYDEMKEDGKLKPFSPMAALKTPTQYELLKASGELAKQRAATEARCNADNSKNALDTNAQRGV